MADNITTNTTERVALVTGGSAGLGLALSRELARQGWRVITDGRSEEKFKEAELPEGVTVLVGDLTDAEHRAVLLAEVERHGRLDLLVHNASTLGPTSPTCNTSGAPTSAARSSSPRRSCRGCAPPTACSSRSAPTPR